MKIFFRSNTREVIAIGGMETDNPNIESADIELTDEDEQKIQDGYKMFYNGSLVFEPTPVIENSLKKEEMRQELAKDLDAIEKVSDFNEIKKILVKLANKVYNT